MYNNKNIQKLFVYSNKKSLAGHYIQPTGDLTERRHDY